MNFIDSNLESELNKGLKEVEVLLAEHIKGEYPLVVETSRHLVEAGGKRFRPMLTLIASHFGAGQNRQVIEAAVVCELTHVATLYHDDVMDEAPLRRGVESANSRWGNASQSSPATISSQKHRIYWPISALKQFDFKLKPSSA